MTDVKLDAETVTAIQLAMMRATAPHKRGQHSKMHGCVDAVLEVLGDLPAELKQGLFAQADAFDALVRFSNGSQADDREPDIHGMAIKLLEVPGDKALADAPEGSEQDFILADNPVFFVRNASDYVRFMEDFAHSAPRGLPPNAFIAYLKERHPEDIPVLQSFRQQVQATPLGATYWSQVPYAFGPHDKVACRYRARPLQTVSEPQGATHDYLRERMVERLRAGSAPVVFELQVQIKQNASQAVIDNPTIEWDEPFVTVALLSIPAQDFDTEARHRLGERLSFSPWHSLAAHRPLGEINEVRKLVYLASRDLRDTLSTAGSGNLRLSEEELTRHIDDDFKAVIDRLRRTFGFLSHTKRGRGTHTWGVAGRGTARFVVSPDFPENDYFVFGRVVPVILRHSSPGAREDDRARDGVAASLKLFDDDSDTNGPGALDILMNAGRQLFVRTIRDFSTFVHASDEERKQLVADGIMMEPELIEAYRIRGSFLDSRYHSWQCFELYDIHGSLSYLRFRLIPGDRGPERGLPAREFRAEGAPSMDPVPDDPRAPDFLRQEWIHQVKYSEVRYLLQGQLHAPGDPGDPNPEVLNPARAWDEEQHPWMDLCEIRIDEPILDNDVVSALDMTPNRSPACIRLPLATSPDQYASLGHARALVYPGARAVRAASDEPQSN